MPSANVTANTSAQTLFSVPKQKLGKITKIEIDNATGNPVTVTIQDVYTPDASVGNSSPTEQTETKKVITVAANGHYESRDLDLDIIGTAKAVASATDTSVNISVIYHYE